MGTAIASFRLSGANANESLFVVDVWRQSGTQWKLAIRYEAPALASFTLPGAGGDGGDLPKKY